MNTWTNVHIMLCSYHERWIVCLLKCEMNCRYSIHKKFWQFELTIMNQSKYLPLRSSTQYNSGTVSITCFIKVTGKYSFSWSNSIRNIRNFQQSDWLNTTLMWLWFKDNHKCFNWSSGWEDHQRLQRKCFRVLSNTVVAHTLEMSFWASSRSCTTSCMSSAYIIPAGSLSCGMIEMIKETYWWVKAVYIYEVENENTSVLLNRSCSI